MTVTVPAVTPVTTPVPEPIVAMAVLLLLHVPPVEGSPRVMVAPAHTVEGPVIGLGCVSVMANVAEVSLHPSETVTE